MASHQSGLSLLARGMAQTLRSPVRPAPSIPSFLCPFQQQSRGARNSSKSKSKGKVKKQKNKAFKQYDMKDAVQFSLCDAMRLVRSSNQYIEDLLIEPINRYIRAFEVGQEPTSAKYEIHLKLRTKKDGPVIRNQLRLPNAVQTDTRVCVICPPGSRTAKEAKEAGAILVGEEEVFEAVKAGNIDFDRCICHTSSLTKLNQAGLGRFLGPKGLMPSVKLGTVVDNVSVSVSNMRGGLIYRERDGVVRIPVGQLRFTPDELRTNIRTFIAQVKKDASGLSDQISKEIAEVVSNSCSRKGSIV